MRPQKSAHGDLNPNSGAVRRLPAGPSEARRATTNVRLARLLREKLTESSLSSVQVSSSVAVDLADIAAIAQRHESRLKALLKLRFPRDLGKLEDLLVGFQVDLLWENQWHLISLKRELPKLLRRLNQRLRGKPASTRNLARRRAAR